MPAVADVRLAALEFDDAQAWLRARPTLTASLAAEVLVTAPGYCHVHQVGDVRGSPKTRCPQNSMSPSYGSSRRLVDTCPRSLAVPVGPGKLME